MRVTLTTEGGLAYFPGLARPVTIDDTTLPPEQSAELHRLVAAADFFHQPPVAGMPPPGAADYRTYTLTIEDADHTNTLRMTDLTQDPALRDLLRYVQSLRSTSQSPGNP